MKEHKTLIEATIPPLVAWYRENKKDLPWRREQTPYHVWISEIMLQQTRTAAVIPYYERFIRELPTVSALAEVSDERLMKLWEGLGYYSRARNLKKCAIDLCERYGGELPRTAEELRTLAGIGPYTAGAIASIAYGEPSPAVDGNVLRVLMRLMACFRDIADEKTKMELTALLAEVYPTGEDASLLTEGLMELGETVCPPNTAPHCECCPVRTLCLANKGKIAELLPVKSPKKPRRIEERTVFLLKCGNKYAIRKRVERGLLYGLFEFPSILGYHEEKTLGEALSAWGIRPRSIQALDRAKHIFTHVEWHMKGVLVECDEISKDFLWHTPSELRCDFAIPTAFRHYLAMLP